VALPLRVLAPWIRDVPHAVGPPTTAWAGSIDGGQLQHGRILGPRWSRRSARTACSNCWRPGATAATST